MLVIVLGMVGGAVFFVVECWTCVSRACVYAHMYECINCKLTYAAAGRAAGEEEALVGHPQQLLHLL